MKRHGGILSKLNEGEEADLKKLQTLWLQLYDTLEKAER